MLEVTEDLIIQLAEKYYYNDIDLIEKLAELKLLQLDDVSYLLKLDSTIEWKNLDKNLMNFYYQRALDFFSLQYQNEVNIVE